MFIDLVLNPTLPSVAAEVDPVAMQTAMLKMVGKSAEGSFKEFMSGMRLRHLVKDPLTGYAPDVVHPCISELAIGLGWSQEHLCWAAEPTSPREEWPAMQHTATDQSDRPVELKFRTVVLKPCLTGANAADPTKRNRVGGFGMPSKKKSRRKTKGAAAEARMQADHGGVTDEEDEEVEQRRAKRLRHGIRRMQAEDDSDMEDDDDDESPFDDRGQNSGSDSDGDEDEETLATRDGTVPTTSRHDAKLDSVCLGYDANDCSNPDHSATADATGRQYVPESLMERDDDIVQTYINAAQMLDDGYVHDCGSAGMVIGDGALSANFVEQVRRQLQGARDLQSLGDGSCWPTTLPLGVTFILSVPLDDSSPDSAAETLIVATSICGGAPELPIATVCPRTCTGTERGHVTVVPRAVWDAFLAGDGSVSTVTLVLGSTTNGNEAWAPCSHLKCHRDCRSCWPKWAADLPLGVDVQPRLGGAQLTCLPCDAVSCVEHAFRCATAERNPTVAKLAANAIDGAAIRKELVESHTLPWLTHVFGGDREAEADSNEEAEAAIDATLDEAVLNWLRKQTGKAYTAKNPKARLTEELLKSADWTADVGKQRQLDGKYWPRQRVLAHWLSPSGKPQPTRSANVGWWPAQIMRRGTVEEEKTYKQVVYWVRYDERDADLKHHVRLVPEKYIASALAHPARNVAAAEAMQVEAEYAAPKKVSAQQMTPRGEQPEFNTVVKIDLSTGAITGNHPAQVFGDTPVLLSALCAVEYVNGQLIRLLGGNTKTLYTGALVRPPPNICT
jgi:hypothetical protein